MAERVGFEPTVPLPVRLISSQVHSTTLPPLRVLAVKTPDYARTCLHVNEKSGEGWGAVAAGAGGLMRLARPGRAGGRLCGVDHTRTIAACTDLSTLF